MTPPLFKGEDKDRVRCANPVPLFGIPDGAGGLQCGKRMLMKKPPMNGTVTWYCTACDTETVELLPIEINHLQIDKD